MRVSKAGQTYLDRQEGNGGNRSLASYGVTPPKWDRLCQNLELCTSIQAMLVEKFMNRILHEPKAASH